MTNQIVTQEHLIKQFDYDKYTGVFTRKVPMYRKPNSVGEVAGGISANGYRYISIDKKHYLAHRLAWLYVYGAWPKNQIDHINGIRADNRICNLREATPSENNQNVTKARAGSLVDYLGVSYGKNGKFRARIHVNNKLFHIGTFLTAEDARDAYLSTKRNLHNFCTI